MTRKETPLSPPKAERSPAMTGSQPPLADQLVGYWVLEGTIAGKQTTHDVEAQWVLNHEYVQIREISRQRRADGSPQYEAVVYLAWNESAQEYSCLWLDSTEAADFSQIVIGRARPEEDRIPFVFNFRGRESFHTTFRYDPKTDTWEWMLENHQGTEVTPFADVRLRRQK